MRGREATHAHGTEPMADTKDVLSIVVRLPVVYSVPPHLAKEQRRSVHSEGHDDREKEHHVDREGAGMRPIPSPVLPLAFHRRLTLVVSFSAGVERQYDAQRARHETHRPHRVLDQDAQPENQNREQGTRQRGQKNKCS